MKLLLIIDLMLQKAYNFASGIWGNRSQAAHAHTLFECSIAKERLFPKMFQNGAFFRECSRIASEAYTSSSPHQNCSLRQYLYADGVKVFRTNSIIQFACQKKSMSIIFSIKKPVRDILTGLNSCFAAYFSRLLFQVCLRKYDGCSTAYSILYFCIAVIIRTIADWL